MKLFGSIFFLLCATVAISTSNGSAQLRPILVATVPSATPVSIPCTGSIASPLYDAIERGAQIQIGAGECSIDRTMTVTADDVYISGQGGGFPGAQGAANYATQITWAGTTGGVMFQWGATDRDIERGGLSNLSLNASCGTACAGVGLYLTAVEGGQFTRLSFDDGFSTAAVMVGAQANDTMHNYFSNLAVSNARNSGDGIVIGNVDNDSAYYNEFHNIWTTMHGGVGIYFAKSSGNLVFNVQQGTDGGSNAPWGVVLGCGSKYNRMYWLTPSSWVPTPTPNPDPTPTQIHAVYAAGTEFGCSSADVAKDVLEAFDVYDNGGYGAMPIFLGTNAHVPCGPDWAVAGNYQTPAPSPCPTNAVTACLCPWTTTLATPSPVPPASVPTTSNTAQP